MAITASTTLFLRLSSRKSERCSTGSSPPWATRSPIWPTTSCSGLCRPRKRVPVSARFLATILPASAFLTVRPMWTPMWRAPGSTRGRICRSIWPTISFGSRRFFRASSAACATARQPARTPPPWRRWYLKPARAQHVLLRLAGGVARDRLDEADMFGLLVGRQVLGAGGDHLVGRERHALVHHDVGAADLAPALVGHAHHRH